jgi:membrane protease YdiL (CAAX protease family)
MGPIAAIILAAALHSIAYGLNLFWIHFAFSIVVGAIYVRTASLWCAIIAHLATNYTILISLL